ncbi:LysR family transcriptional regulator [Erwinia mallotivora]|uniref:LysR family transcriptional regulator n=1 Tax=Erwinia mallotivora TaxID=69222 RepID=UPI0021BF00B2|nr:LysR family transcriptional regulator [Erwinia mallotivora]
MAVAENNSFTKASGEFCVSVSAVSQAIKRLEQHLSSPLFVRQGNHIELTREGRVLRDYGKKVFNTLDECLKQIGFRESLIRIFSPPGVSSFLFSQRLLGELSEHVKNIEMVADEQKFTGDLQQWDLAILLDSTLQTSEVLTYLGDDIYFPFCHPSIAEKIHSPDDLFNYPLFFNQHGLACWEEFFSLNNIQPATRPRRIFYSRASQLIAGVESREGIGFESARVLAAKIKSKEFVLCPLPSLRPVIKKIMWLYINPSSPIHSYMGDIKNAILKDFCP